MFSRSHLSSIRARSNPWVPVLALLFASSCSGAPSTPEKPDPVYGPGCSGPTDCAADQTCLHGSCVQTPTSGATLPEAHLFATPSQLRFGTMAAGESRSLSLVLENDGEAMVTIERTRIEPATAPFRIEPLGSGPFWIRPGRSRAIFVTFAPLAIGNYDAELAIESRAPTVRVTLSAP